MTAIESTSARLGLAAERPDRKRGCRADPANLRAGTLAECSMLIEKAARGLKGAKALSLVELARILDPDSFQEWKSASQAWYEAMIHPDIVQHRRYPLAQQRIDNALAKINGSIREIVASPRFLAQGFGPPGTLENVPRAIAEKLVVDIEAGTLATAAGWRWERVTIKRATAASLAADAQAARPKRADRKHRQRETRRLIKELYDGCMPPKFESPANIRRRLATEKNWAVGDDTVLRALGRKR